jgi:hypothetical protein
MVVHPSNPRKVEDRRSARKYQARSDKISKTRGMAQMVSTCLSSGKHQSHTKEKKKKERKKGIHKLS